MSDTFVVDLSPSLKQGVLLVEKGDLEGAWRTFAEMRSKEPDNPIVLSYLGMLKSVREGKVYEGIEECQEAVKKDPHESLSYLNLARAYLAARDRYQAIRAIHKGLKIRSPHSAMLLAFYHSLGMRRKPPIPFLHRDNPLNIFLGRLTWKLGTSKKPSTRTATSRRG